MKFYPLITSRWWPSLTSFHGSRKCCSGAIAFEGSQEKRPYNFSSLKKRSSLGPLKAWNRALLDPFSSSSDHTATEGILEDSTPKLNTDDLLNRTVPGNKTEQEVLLVMNNGRTRELQKFKGFGPKIARNIMKFRRQEKFFTSLDELIRVPLIGPARFATLVGRESLFITHPLHATLRIPPSRKIEIADLQPVLWPTPDIPRIHLGNPQDTLSERRLANRHNLHLRMHRIQHYILFIHQKNENLSGWSKYLQQNLPRLLRQKIQTIKKQ